MAAGLAWSDLAVNRALVVAAVFLLILSLPDLLRLAPHLLYSFDRSRGSAELEHSVSMARARNITALFLSLPFCLVADRYALLRPGFWERIPEAWSAPATLGVLAVFLLVRTLCYAVFRPGRLSAEEFATLKHLPYNHFILLAALSLLSAGIFSVTGLPEAFCRTVLLWETGLVWLFALIRCGQFLDGHGFGFTTFLYLCGLEIIPAALLVAVVMFF